MDRPTIWPKTAGAESEEGSVRAFRLLLAALFAPLVPGLLVAVPDVIAGNLGTALWYVGFSAIAGYATLLVVGFPLFLWLGNKQSLRFIHCVLIGLVCGVTAYFGAFIPGAIADPHALGRALYSTLAFMPLAAIFGAIGGAAFWLIAPRGLAPPHHDQDAST
jgi:hypothetical protein